MELGEGGWSWVEVGARFSNTHLIFQKKGLKRISNIELSEKRFKILLDSGSESFLFLNTPCFNNTIGIMQC